MKFEKLSKKNQTKLISDINTYIANNKNSGGNDYIFGKALARGAGTLFGEFRDKNEWDGEKESVKRTGTIDTFISNGTSLQYQKYRNELNSR